MKLEWIQIYYEEITMKLIKAITNTKFNAILFGLAIVELFALFAWALIFGRMQ